MTAPDRWMLDRIPVAPPELAKRLAEGGGEAWVDTENGDPVHLRFTALARSALERALDKGGRDRGAAFDLLVADGLLTYACEAAAEGPEPAEDLSVILNRFLDFDRL